MTSLKLIRCPECGGTSVASEPLEESDRRLNVKAKIMCRRCAHEWEGEVSNPARRWFSGLPDIRKKRGAV